MTTFEEIYPYVKGMQRDQGICNLFMDFKQEWSVRANKEGTIKVQWHDGMQSWIFQYNEKDLAFDEFCEFVKYTIDTNKETEAKFELLNRKKKELEELFKSNSIDDLNRLGFQFEVNGCDKDPEPVSTSCETDAVTEVKTVPTTMKAAMKSKKAGANA